MNYLIYGEDRRHAYLSALLTNAGMTMQAPADLLILSPRESIVSHTDDIKEEGLVFGGPAGDNSFLKEHGYRKLTQSDAFRRKNSEYTAEGALSIAITETTTALCDTPVALLGYGYLGKACARLFSRVGAPVTVYTENPGERAGAVVDGFPSKELTSLSDLSGMLLLNTIPFPVLDSFFLSAADAPAVLIELASVPCITKEVAGLRLVPAGALPSRFMPASAAILMFEEITAQIKKE